MISPTLPSRLAPVEITTDPEGPDVVCPDNNETPPLAATPVDEALVTDKLPLDPSTPLPLSITTEPPVPIDDPPLEIVEPPAR
jgi:hypothetical protein